jgi:hypothetical protein
MYKYNNISNNTNEMQPSMIDQSSPIFGDYNSELREVKPRADGIYHIDTPRLIAKLKELKVNSYYFLIWSAPSDWDDFRQAFLPAAEKANINVWVYLVPPSEKPPESFGEDYVAWFQAIGELSCSYPCLKGIVIDDFNDNIAFFTPNYLQQMRLAGQKRNPCLQFYPLVYYPNITPTFVRQLQPFIDGFVFAFRDDPYHNTQRVNCLAHQINTIQSILRPYQLPLVLMIYASSLSGTPAAPSPSYMEKTLKIGMEYLLSNQIQGIITYALIKDEDKKTDDHRAYCGTRYASFFSPGEKGKRNEFADLWQTVPVYPTGPYSLSFVHFNSQPSMHTSPVDMEIFIDQIRIWTQSEENILHNEWKYVCLDLTPYLTGKERAALTIRLFRKEDGAQLFIAGIDHLQSCGFLMQNPDFAEKKKCWTIRTNSCSLLVDVLTFDPQRNQKVFDVVRKYFNKLAQRDVK